MNHENLSKFIAFLQTPPLWQGNYDGLEQFDFPNIDLENFQMNPIPENIRLGHQMESVFLQLLQHSNRYRVHANNIPIRKDKISLGEIDFILEDFEKKKILHVELTFKFYILDPAFSDPIYQLIGPNKRDTFFAKKEKIKNHQIPLVYSNEGIRVLREIEVNAEKLEHKVCFKAQIFLPWEMKNHNISPLNNQCRAGFWLTKDEFSSYMGNSDKFHIPLKKQWPQSPTPELEWHSYLDVIGTIDSQLANKNSPMVWIKKPNGEFLKVFVVWWL